LASAEPNILARGPWERRPAVADRCRFHRGRSEALDALPPRLDSRYLIPARRGGPFDLANFRRREWSPAVEAAGVRTPARIYDLRSTFASNALAAGVSVFELARIMGTSVAMIERSYGTLIEGAGADIARRLGAFETAHERSGVVVASGSEPEAGG
jgi:integrase